MRWPWVSRAKLDLLDGRLEVLNQECRRLRVVVSARDHAIGELQGRVSVLLGASESPDRLAELFASLVSHQQAAILNAIGKNFMSWQGGGSMQCHYIVNGSVPNINNDGLDENGKWFVDELAGSFRKEEPAP